jgi:hypothetical protein
LTGLEKKRTKRSKFANKPKKEDPNSDSLGLGEERRRGQAFTENELKTLLFGIYEGLDNAKTAEKFLSTHKGTGRNKQALKSMIFFLLMKKCA